MNVNGGNLVKTQNEGAQPAPITTVKSLLAAPNLKKKFEDMLGKKASGFIASIINISNSKSLLGAEPMSIIASAAVAATLDLPIDPNLGHAWIVPFKEKGIKKAQFQMATRGYVQLAQRSSQYLRINTIIVHQNQFKSWNALTEELNADFTVEGEGEVVGYAAYFKLINGFEKLVYWPKAKVLSHAKRYSKSFDNGPWQTHFDEMALKTVLKSALKNWGVLSIEMQTAMIADQAVIKEEVLKGGDITENVEYVDNPQNDAQDVEFTEENKTDEFADTPFAQGGGSDA